MFMDSLIKGLSMSKVGGVWEKWKTSLKCHFIDNLKGQVDVSIYVSLVLFWLETVLEKHTSGNGFSHLQTSCTKMYH